MAQCTHSQLKVYTGKASLCRPGVSKGCQRASPPISPCRCQSFLLAQNLFRFRLKYRSWFGAFVHSCGWRNPGPIPLESGRKVHGKGGWELKVAGVSNTRMSCLWSLCGGRAGASEAWVWGPAPPLTYGRVTWGRLLNLTGHRPSHAAKEDICTSLGGRREGSGRASTGHSWSTVGVQYMSLLLFCFRHFHTHLDSWYLLNGQMDPLLREQLDIF